MPQITSETTKWLREIEKILRIQGGLLAQIVANLPPTP